MGFWQLPLNSSRRTTNANRGFYPDSGSALCATNQRPSSGPHQRPRPRHPSYKTDRLRQIDRPDVRVLRVEVAPNGVRSVTPMMTLSFTSLFQSAATSRSPSAAKPVEAPPCQVFYMQKGTPHGFRNTGSSPAMAMEVFVKDNAVTAQKSGTLIWGGALNR